VARRRKKEGTGKKGEMDWIGSIGCRMSDVRTLVRNMIAIPLASGYGCWAGLGRGGEVSIVLFYHHSLARSLLFLTDFFLFSDESV